MTLFSKQKRFGVRKKLLIKATEPQTTPQPSRTQSHSFPMRQDTSHKITGINGNAKSVRLTRKIVSILIQVSVELSKMAFSSSCICFLSVADDVKGWAVSMKECAVGCKHKCSLCVNTVIYVFMSLHMRDRSYSHTVWFAGMRTEVNPYNSCVYIILCPSSNLTRVVEMHLQIRMGQKRQEHFVTRSCSSSLFLFPYYYPPSSSYPISSSGLSSGTKTNPCLTVSITHLKAFVCNIGERMMRSVEILSYTGLDQNCCIKNQSHHIAVRRMY